MEIDEAEVEALAKSYAVTTTTSRGASEFSIDELRGFARENLRRRAEEAAEQASEKTAKAFAQQATERTVTLSIADAEMLLSAVRSRPHQQPEPRREREHAEQGDIAHALGELTRQLAQSGATDREERRQADAEFFQRLEHQINQINASHERRPSSWRIVRGADGKPSGIEPVEEAHAKK